MKPYGAHIKHCGWAGWYRARAKIARKRARQVARKEIAKSLKEE